MLTHRGDVLFLSVSGYKDGGPALEQSCQHGGPAGRGSHEADDHLKRRAKDAERRRGIPGGREDSLDGLAGPLMTVRDTKSCSVCSFQQSPPWDSLLHVCFFTSYKAPFQEYDSLFKFSSLLCANSTFHAVSYVDLFVNLCLFFTVFFDV